MTKLRSRLLVSLVLAAVVLTAVGVDVASAWPARGRTAPGQSPSYGAMNRPGVGSLAGEPDPNMGGAPQPVVKPASLTGLPSHWLANLWITWRMRSPQAQLPARR
jgi:hypothetical protein